MTTGSYRDIVRSSALIGGSSAIGIAVGLLRTKAMALLLGPAAFGLMGAYLALSELARAVAQLGINASGVRQIAAAVAGGDAARIACTVTVLRRTALACAALGAAAMVLLALPLARLSFGDGAHAGDIALLGAAVFFAVVAAGQGALLQGMRRIGDLARLGLVGGVASTVVGVPMVWWLGAAGVAPTLVMVAAVSLLASWRYARAIRVPTVTLARGEFTREAAALLRLGLAFMASGLLTLGASYLVRVIVLRGPGLEAAGLYQAAWTIAGIATGFVLQALGTDFYPRLVAAQHDSAQANRLVNEQAQVSMLLALPGVLATLSLAPLVVPLLYSQGFGPAAGVLRWLCLGMALRVLTWPIGYIVIAQGRQSLFLATEVAWAGVNLVLTWLCVGAWGLDGAGIAFFGSYVFHALLVYPIARRASGFRWSRANKLGATCFALTIGAVFGGWRVLPGGAALAFGVFATVVATAACLRALVLLVGPAGLPPRLARLLRRVAPVVGGEAS